MLIGISGRLLSQDYAEHWLATRRSASVEDGSRDPAGDRTRLALARWWDARGSRLGPASPVRAVVDVGLVPVLELLGFDVREPRLLHDGRVVVADAQAPAGGTADAAAGIPVLTTCWGASMDGLWPDLAREGARRQADWALAFNGRALRLCDLRRPHARAHIDFDLELLGRAPAACVLWRSLLHAEALRGTTASVVDDSARYGIAVASSLKDGVRDGLETLLNGLLASVRPPRLKPPAARRGEADGGRIPELLDEALTVIYRVLFLLFAESRALVPTWHPVYRRHYSVEALRAAIERPGAAAGLWESLQAMARLAHTGCRAGTLVVPPFNGRLFSPSRAPLADSLRLDDDVVAAAMRALTTHRARGGCDRIRFRDLGVEQLGAVYESVLDYEPVVVASRVRLVGTGLVRKASGTYYTPASITHEIVRRTLDPLVADASPEAILRLRVLDPAMGSGAFLVAACRHLASAYEAALVRDRGLFPSEISEADRAEFRRTVARRCLYGVDLNPMAVQVARLSMWLMTLAQGRPLSFLDHRLVAGNSLVSASLDDVARQPPGRSGRSRSRGDAPLPLFADDDAGAVVRTALPIRARLEDEADDTAATVRGKERLLAGLEREAEGIGALRRMADAWCACWFWPDPAKAPRAAEFGELAVALRAGRGSLPTHVAAPRLEEAARVAAAERFLHWTIVFPEVFYGPDGAPRVDGGFDAILGNPPWEMLRGDAGSADARGQRRRASDALIRFVRESGTYRAAPGGHVNQYQLFVERAVTLLRPGGRLGLVLPWGLAADQGSAPLRRLLFDRCRIDMFAALDNARGLFPIHRSVRFLLLGAQRGGPTTRLRVERTEETVTLTPALLRRLGGDALPVPWLRGVDELRLLERLACAHPALGDPSGGWGATFGRELNATDDRDRFSSTRGGLPVIEGKHLSPFRVAVSDGSRWVPSAATLPSLALRRAVGRPRLAYRDVASATNRTTLIAALVPRGAVTVHTLFCLRTPLDDADQWFLCAVLNSLTANALVRPWVGTHLGTATVERLPVPRPGPGDADRARIVGLARALARGDRDDGGADEGFDDRRCEIEARVMRLYGLSGDEVRVVLDGFPLIPRPRLDAIAEAFRRLAACGGRV